jgi:hypothetical protein
MFAFSFGVVVRPPSFTQYWMWIKWSLPNGKQVYGVSLASLLGHMANKKRNLFLRKEDEISHADHLFDLLLVNVLWSRLQKEEVVSW